MAVRIDSPIVAVTVLRDGKVEARWQRERAPRREEAAARCPECGTEAVVNLDGCLICLNCGDSRCG